MAGLQAHVSETFSAVPKAKGAISSPAREKPIIRMKRESLDRLGMPEHHFHEQARIQVEDPDGEIHGGYGQELPVRTESHRSNGRSNPSDISHEIAFGS